jgi:Flp pilus assembly protein TadB
MPIFVVAVFTAILTYSLLWRRLQHRDTAHAVRRLAAQPTDKHGPRRGRPRLIEAASEVRGLFTGRLLDGLRLREAALRLLDTAALKWTPGRLLQGSIGLFLAGFVAVTAIMGNTSPLVALLAGAALGATPWWYARRKARSPPR